MKAFCAQVILLLTVCCTLQFTSAAQTSYVFKNPTLESGTALSVGAVYRFLNVQPGTSAKVTVMSATGGITLDAIDENWTGFDDAFQPFINVGTSSNGYVEFKVEFCVGNSNVPAMQSYVPVTCIDVDGTTYGNGVLYEKDQIQFFPGYFDFSMTGGNISVNSVSNWVVVKNTSGVSYNGIDTTAKDVMATVVNRFVSGFLIRIGAQNSSPTKSEVRYRSVYFKSFTYGHAAPLAMSSITNLSGSRKDAVVELNMTFDGSNTCDKMIIERSPDASSFTAIGEADVPPGHGISYDLSYTDRMPLLTDKSYYRVKLVQSATGKSEYSNTLVIKNSDAQGTFKLQNTVINSGNPVLLIQSAEAAQVQLRIADLSGILLYNATVKLNAGANNISLDRLKRSSAYGVVMIEAAGQRKNTKVFIQ